MTLDKFGFSLGSKAQLTGTPTKAGVYTFTVKASNQNLGVSNVKEFTITISENSSVSKVKIVGSFSNGVKGKLYSSSVTQAAGTKPFYWFLTKGSLPTGLTLKGDESDTVTLTGTPTEIGTFSFTLELMDTYSATEQDFTINITDGSSGGSGGDDPVNPDNPDDPVNPDNPVNPGGEGVSGGSGGGCDTGVAYLWQVGLMMVGYGLIRKRS